MDVGIVELELGLDGDEGFRAPIAAAVAERDVNASCCREKGAERPGLSAVRERNRTLMPRNLWLHSDDDADGDGLCGVAGRGPGLSTEPIAHERIDALDEETLDSSAAASGEELMRGRAKEPSRSTEKSGSFLFEEQR